MAGRPAQRLHDLVPAHDVPLRDVQDSAGGDVGVAGEVEVGQLGGIFEWPLGYACVGDPGAIFLQHSHRLVDYAFERRVRRPSIRQFADS